MGAAVVGYGSQGLGAPAAGPELAAAAGFALAALAVLPVVTGRDILRVGIGLMLLLSGALLVRTNLGGTPDPLEQLIDRGARGDARRGGRDPRRRGAVGRRGRLRDERIDPGPDRVTPPTPTRPSRDEPARLRHRRLRLRRSRGGRAGGRAGADGARPRRAHRGARARRSRSDPGQAVAIGGGGIATTAYLRLFLVLGSLVGLGLAVSGLAGGSRRDAPAVTLAILAACGLTLGLVDPRAAVLAATAGGLFGVLVTLIPGNGRAGATVGIRETRAVIVAGALAIAATAWFGRDLSQLAAQPVVFGLAYLAFAVAVAMRFGAIPFHLWAARLTDVVPETALPILTAMAPASLAIVALAWTDASVAPLLVDLGAGAVCSSSPSRSRRSSWRPSRPSSRTTSSTSSATRSSATRASSCWRSPRSTRRSGRRPGPGSSSSSSRAAPSRPGSPASARGSGRAGSPTCAAGSGGRRS